MSEWGENLRWWLGLPPRVRLWTHDEVVADFLAWLAGGTGEWRFPAGSYSPDAAHREAYRIVAVETADFDAPNHRARLDEWRRRRRDLPPSPAPTSA